MFFVAGITGKVGGAAARHLVASGKSVRTIVRDPAKASAWSEQGVDVRRGDWNDSAALTDALRGVEGAFVMMPPIMAPAPGYPEAKAVIASYVEAFRQSPPPRVVALSSFGSEKPSGLGLITSTHLMEQAFADLPFPTAFVRPGSFIENYLFAVKMAAAAGEFPIFLTPTDRAVPMTATADIGKQIARLLVDGWAGKKVVEIGTPYSPDDLAAALTKVVGKPVRAKAVPRDQWSAVLAHQGVPADSTGPYEEMMDGVNSGWIDFGTPDAESVAGTTTPMQVFQAAGDD